MNPVPGQTAPLIFQAFKLMVTRSVLLGQLLLSIMCTVYIVCVYIVCVYMYLHLLSIAVYVYVSLQSPPHTAMHRLLNSPTMCTTILVMYTV